MKNNNKTGKRKCVICNSVNISYLSPQEYGILKCRNCGVIYIIPTANESEYFKAISDHYSNFDPAYKVALSRENLYKRFLSRIEQIKPINSKVLDIGCSWGYFLSLCKEQGLKPYGVEIVPKLAQIGIEKYKLNIKCSDFQKVKFPTNHFDIITLWNTFGEMPFPEETILKIKKILKPRGVLFLRTPNAQWHIFIYRIIKLLEKLHVYHLIPKHSFIFHHFTFSNKSLKIFLKNNGFKNIEISNSPPTKGDPYNVKKGVKFLKFLSYFIAQLIFILSFGEITFAPSIEILAENAKS